MFRLSRYRRIFLAAGCVCLVFLSFAVYAYHFDKVLFRRVLFQPVRESLYLVKELGLPWHWRDISTYSADDGDIVRVASGAHDEITLSGELRFPSGSDSAPTVLLLHGSAPWGRKAGLIRLLTARLLKDGWAVLAPDARGFGDSDDPIDPFAVDAWNPQEDLQNWIDALVVTPRVDFHNIVVIAHSLGAGQALAGFLDDPRIKALVLIGPPRYLSSAPSTLWERVRYSADRDLSAPISPEADMRIRRQLDIQRYLDGSLSGSGHMPIMLIDGEFEGDAT